MHTRIPMLVRPRVRGRSRVSTDISNNSIKKARSVCLRQPFPVVFGISGGGPLVGPDCIDSSPAPPATPCSPPASGPGQLASHTRSRAAPLGCRMRRLRRNTAGPLGRPAPSHRKLPGEGRRIPEFAEHTTSPPTKRSGSQASGLLLHLAERICRENTARERGRLFPSSVTIASWNCFWVLEVSFVLIAALPFEAFRWAVAILHISFFSVVLQVWCAAANSALDSAGC